MTETIAVTLSPDEDGYIGRECPTCQSYFKIRPGTGVKDQERAYCPYCREANDPENFATTEQLNYATGIAAKQIQHALLAPLKSLKQTGPNVQITVTAEESPVHSYQERGLETAITCDSCTLEYKIYGVFATCPDCDTSNSRQILQGNLALLRHQLNEADERITEDILKNTVSTFDAFGRATTEHEGTKISFQNLDHAEVQLQSTGHSLRAHTTREEWDFLTTSFQKRHVLTHNMGVIDEQYLQRANEPDAIIGRKIRLKKHEVERTIDLLDRLAGKITFSTPPPPPSPPTPRKARNPYQLGHDARRLAMILFSNDTDGIMAHMSSKDAQEQLGLDRLHFEAARDELIDHRLVEQQHRILFSTMYMPLAFIDELDYSPTKDDELVARALSEANQGLMNRELAERVGINTQRLNHAVRRLDDKGAISVGKALGTAPYSFRSARATGATLRYLSKFA